MSQPYLGQIDPFSFEFAPKGWALCDGQLLSINQNQALFALLGTTFGGNGSTTFALPDLRSRVPVGFSNTLVLGETTGQESHTITNSEMPQHTHTVHASSSTASTRTPASNTVFAEEPTGKNAYYSTTVNTTMNPAAVSSVGGSQSHENRQPFLVINFCIALAGIFPSRN